MVVFGIVVLLCGVGAFWLAVSSQRSVHRMMATETLSVPELEDLRRIATELSGPGSFRKVCEVVGETAPAPVGMLRSELAGVDCVWHSHRVQRRFTHYERDDDGDRKATTRTETVAEQTSPHGWALLRDGHTIGVDHGGRRPEGVEQVLDRFDPASAPQPAGLAGVLGALSGGGRDETIGYQYTEWVLRPGTRMYVLGEVDDRDGPLVIRPPQDSKDGFVLSTRSEEDLTRSARKSQRLWAWVGAALVVAGLVLLVVGLVT